MTCQLSLYSLLHGGFPKFMPMTTQIWAYTGEVSGFVLLCGRVQEGLVTPSPQHPALQMNPGLQTACNYPDMLMAGSCQCEKSEAWSNSSHGPATICVHLRSRWALRYNME